MSNDTHGVEEDKYVIAVDLDGTLAEYNGWKGIDHIGKPIEKMVKKVVDAHNDGTTIYIFTARIADERGARKNKILHYIEDWLLKHDIPFDEITCIKHKVIREFWDDRAVCVVPNSGMFSYEQNLICDESSLDQQIGGNHYSKLNIQPAEYCEYNKLPALEAGVIKYVTRHEDKNGIEDIDKAIDLLNMIRDMRYSDKGKQSLINRLEKL